MELLVSAAVATAFALGVAGASVSSIHMDAHAVTCQSFSISWVGGTPPFRLTRTKKRCSLADAADPDPPILSITQSDNTFVWVPNVPPDTTVQLRLQDSAGTLGQTSSFNIQKGTDTSCVVQNPVAPNPSSGLSPFASPLASLSITSSAPSSRATISSSPVSSQAVASNLPSSGDTPNATDNRIVVAAVVPVCVSVFAVLLYYLFVRMRRRTTGARVEYPFTDPESVLTPTEPLPTSVVVAIPAHSRSVSEKGAASTPVSPGELQAALDRIQEMYGLMRELHGLNSTATSSAGERIAELQRRIEELITDNAILSGEQPPPEYE